MDIHMHKIRQFHLGGREKNGRVLGGDDWIHGLFDSLTLQCLGVIITTYLRFEFILKVTSFFFVAAYA